jgi:hypothetical protein
VEEAAQTTAGDVRALFLRFLVNGDGLCRDYAELCCLGQLEHGSQVEEQPPTPRDRQAVRDLRSEKVAWMRAQSLEWQRDHLITDDGTPIGDLDARFVPSEEYVSGAFTGLNAGVYGNSLTARAMSAVRGVDIASIEETKLSEVNLPLFSHGKEYLRSAEEIWRRVQNPTSIPLIVVFFNGAREANGAPSLAGHFAAGVYRGADGGPIAPPQLSSMEVEPAAPATIGDGVEQVRKNTISFPMSTSLSDST